MTTMRRKHRSGLTVGNQRTERNLEIRDRLMVEVWRSRDSAALLAERLGVSPRTVNRYRTALRSRGARIVSPDGVGGFREGRGHGR